MRIIFFLAALLLVAPVAAAGSACELDTGDTPAGRFYVDAGASTDGVSVWVYQESDGEPGCSGGDTVVL